MIKESTKCQADTCACIQNRSGLSLQQCNAVWMSRSWEELLLQSILSNSETLLLSELRGGFSAVRCGFMWLWGSNISLWESNANGTEMSSSNIHRRGGTAWQSEIFMTVPDYLNTYAHSCRDAPTPSSPLQPQIWTWHEILQCCIVGIRTRFSFLKMFHLSHKGLLQI